MRRFLRFTVTIWIVLMHNSIILIYFYPFISPIKDKTLNSRLHLPLRASFLSNWSACFILLLVEIRKNSYLCVVIVLEEKYGENTVSWLWLEGVIHYTKQYLFSVLLLVLLVISEVVQTCLLLLMLIITVKLQRS